ncbi:MAG: phosphoribosylaminoimidazolesuccinocarboxamide synthase [Candidatus Natronoplasma sp.]
MKKLIRKGKIKEVYEISGERLEFFFTDSISVFDKLVPNEIPRKGETLCKTSSYWFEKTEELGINTHFIERKGKKRMEVRSTDLIEDHNSIDEDTTDFLIPLEFITRYFVTGSLHDRIERGEIDHEELGFDQEPERGEKLPESFFEVRGKLEGYERRLTKKEALSISGLTGEEFEEIKASVFKIDGLIKEKVEKNDLVHVKGKKEFAMDENREPMVVDTFGTADEDRWWVKSEYEKGNIAPKSREFIKRHYKDIGYHEKLMKAKKEGKEDPPIPELSEEMVERITEMYVDLMSRLTDGKFR